VLSTPKPAESTYHEEGSLYDANQVWGPITGLLVAGACFALTVVFYLHPIAGIGEYRGVVSNGTAIGGLFALLTVVASIVSIGVGLYVASINTHRVRLLARTFAALSLVNLIAFIVFAIATS
jgi:amino acid transporter